MLVRSLLSTFSVSTLCTSHFITLTLYANPLKQIQLSNDEGSFWANPCHFKKENMFFTENGFTVAEVHSDSNYYCDPINVWRNSTFVSAVNSCCTQKFRWNTKHNRFNENRLDLSFVMWGLLLVCYTLSCWSLPPRDFWVLGARACVYTLSRVNSQGMSCYEAFSYLEDFFFLTRSRILLRLFRFFNDSISPRD